MFSKFQQSQNSFICKVLSSFICFSFLFTTVCPSYVAAQAIPHFLNLPAPGVMVQPTAGYVPALIKGITINPDNPLQFDFIIDTGDSGIVGKQLKDESLRLIRYFLASLTVPEEKMWVNLSPYEEERIIPEIFGKTEMGMDLLAQDYMLKQLTASLMYPEKELGKEFWKRVHKKAKEQFGTTQIPVDTFNKVWIVPKDAVVYEKGNSAFVVKNRLEVVMEADYVARQEGRKGNAAAEDIDEQIIREIVLPEIEREVNEGEVFANLRQIYQSMILATWFKLNLKESLLGQVYVDREKTSGVDIDMPDAKEKIYQQYLEAFQKGVYNYIKEEPDQATGQVIPRKYFSGGTGTVGTDGRSMMERVDQSMLNDQNLHPDDRRIVVQVLESKTVPVAVRVNVMEDTSPQATQAADEASQLAISRMNLIRPSSLTRKGLKKQITYIKGMLNYLSDETNVLGIGNRQQEIARWQRALTINQEALAKKGPDASMLGEDEIELIQDEMRTKTGLGSLAGAQIMADYLESGAAAGIEGMAAHATGMNPGTMLRRVLEANGKSVKDAQYYQASMTALANQLRQDFAEELGLTTADASMLQQREQIERRLVEISGEIRDEEAAWAQFSGRAEIERAQGTPGSAAAQAQQAQINIEQLEREQRILQVRLQRLVEARGSDASQLGEVKREVRGKLLKPRPQFAFYSARQPHAPLEQKWLDNIRAARAEHGWTDEEVRERLQRAQDENIAVGASGNLRLVDGAGSSQDLPQAQDGYTHYQEQVLGRKVEGFNHLPMTAVLASNFRANFPVSLASDPKAIEYSAPQKMGDKILSIKEGAIPAFWETEDKRFVGKGGMKYANAVYHILHDIFGLNGIRIDMDKLAAMTEAGGLESSNAFLAAVVGIGSILSGVDLTEADIFVLSVKLENWEAEGLTGGQGNLSFLLGGAFQTIWLSGIENAAGELLNPYSAVAAEYLNEEQIENYKRHALQLQLGIRYSKDPETGEISKDIPRTAGEINRMWMFLQELEHPEAMETHLRTVDLAHQEVEANKAGDFETAGKALDQLADYRNQRVRIWLREAIAGYDLIIKKIEELRGVTPEYVFEKIQTQDGQAMVRAAIVALEEDGANKLTLEIARRTFFATDSMTSFEMINKYWRKGENLKSPDSEDGLGKGREYLLKETTVLYMDNDAMPIIMEARKAGIHIFPLGAGGPGANMLAVTNHEDGADYISRWLAEHYDIHQVNTDHANSQAERIIFEEGGFFQGWMPIEVGMEPVDWYGFEELGFRLPERAGTRTISAEEVGLPEADASMLQSREQIERRLVEISGEIRDEEAAWAQFSGRAEIERAQGTPGSAAAQAQQAQINIEQLEREQRILQVRLQGIIAAGGDASMLTKIAPAELMAGLDKIMHLLNLKDYKRFMTTLKMSTDPTALVTQLSEQTGKSSDEILKALEEVEFFKSLVFLYKMRNPKTALRREDFSDRTADVTISGDGYTRKGKATAEGHEGHELFQYLQNMREDAENVPFAFRDDMFSFVAEFLGLEGSENAESTGFPNLNDVVDDIIENFFKQGVDLEKIQYFLSSGIGANEMYSHQLSEAVNAFFASMGVNVKWIVVNNPDHMDRIPEDANDSNTIVFEMSRSGGTQETFDFFQRTKDRFKKRVVAAEKGQLNEAGKALAKDDDAIVDLITKIPGYIGGRQMNRKTLMVAAPLFMALAAGSNDVDAAKGMLKKYFEAFYGANEDLDYANQSGSVAVNIAELILTQREVGRNKLRLLFSGSLKGLGNETYQLWNEGAQKPIAGNLENNNLVYEYNLGIPGDVSRFQMTIDSNPDQQLPIFLLDQSSNDYAEMKAYAEGLKDKGLPVIVFEVDLQEGSIEQNLQTIARASALMQDTAVYFTYLTTQDASSNPAVKLVRELTGLAKAIISDSKKNAVDGQDVDIRITVEDLAGAIIEKQQKDLEAAKSDINEVEGELGEDLKSVQDALAELSQKLDLDQNVVATALIQAVSKSVLQIDVGEAANTKTANIKAAFEAAPEVNDLLGQASPEKEIIPLNQQVKLLDEEHRRVSIGLEAGEQFNDAGALVENLAQYLFATLKKKGDDLDNLVLTFMERDEGNATISEISQMMTRVATKVGLSVPTFYLPGRAHSGIEGLMSRADRAFNISIVYTNADKMDNGNVEVGDGVTVNDATYIYGISNVLRMFLGGSRGIIFEVRNDEDLAFIQETLNLTMKRFEEIEAEDADASMLQGEGSQKFLGLLGNILSSVGDDGALKAGQAQKGVQVIAGRAAGLVPLVVRESGTKVLETIKGNLQRRAQEKPGLNESVGIVIAAIDEELQADEDFFTNFVEGEIDASMLAGENGQKFKGFWSQIAGSLGDDGNLKEGVTQEAVQGLARQAAALVPAISQEDDRSAMELLQRNLLRIATQKPALKSAADIIATVILDQLKSAEPVQTSDPLDQLARQAGQGEESPEEALRRMADGSMLAVLNPMEPQQASEINFALSIADGAITGVTAYDEDGKITKAPVLINGEMLTDMQPGAVIVDVSIDQGGNVVHELPEGFEYSHATPAVLNSHGQTTEAVPNMPAGMGKLATPYLSAARQEYLVALIDMVLAMKDGVEWETASEKQREGLKKGIRFLTGENLDDQKLTSQQLDEKIKEALGPIVGEVIANGKLTIGIPAEVLQGERRFGITPEAIKALNEQFKDLLEFRIEIDGGLKSDIPNEAFTAQDNVSLVTAQEAWDSHIVLKIKQPLPQELEMFREDGIVFTYYHLENPEIAESGLKEKLAERRMIAIAYESVRTEDGGTPLLDPMSHIAGWLAGMRYAVYRSLLQEGQQIFDERGVILPEIVEEIDKRLQPIIDFIATGENFELLKRHELVIPDSILAEAQITPNLGEMVIMGGGEVGIEAAHMFLLLGGKDLIVTDTNETRIVFLDQELERIEAMASVKEDPQAVLFSLRTRIARLRQTITELRFLITEKERELQGAEGEQREKGLSYLDEARKKLMRFEMEIRQMQRTLDDARQRVSQEDEAADSSMLIEISSVVGKVEKREYGNTVDYTLRNNRPSFSNKNLMGTLRVARASKETEISWLPVADGGQQERMSITGRHKLSWEAAADLINAKDFLEALDVEDRSVAENVIYLSEKRIMRMVLESKTDMIQSQVLDIIRQVIKSEKISEKTNDKLMSVLRTLSSDRETNDQLFSGSRSYPARLIGQLEEGADVSMLTSEQEESIRIILGEKGLAEDKQTAVINEIVDIKKHGANLSAENLADVLDRYVFGLSLDALYAEAVKISEVLTERVKDVRFPESSIRAILEGIGLAEDKQTAVINEIKDINKHGGAATANQITDVLDRHVLGIAVDVAYVAADKISRLFETGDASQLTDARKGGIDLNAKWLDLKIKRDGKGIALPMSDQPIEDLMAIEGFIPVIINVTPINNLPMILGLGDEEDKDQRASVDGDMLSDELKARLIEEPSLV